MIESISIENYKSIQKLNIDLGRITVLIGANGAGKSNILEAFALSSAALNDKLDNEFLGSRGIRVADDPRFMRAAFTEKNVDKEIKFLIKGGELKVETALQKNNKEPYSPWYDNGDKPLEHDEFMKQFSKARKSKRKLDIDSELDLIIDTFKKLTRQKISHLNLDNFLIYSPELSSLRTFELERQIEPLGIKGEGLFKLLRIWHQSGNNEDLSELKSKLKLIDWFTDFSIPKDLSLDERRLQIKDKYLDSSLSSFDQKSANEGFLFLLFYFSLFISDKTPKFFAIDNIDASLNPKLCTQLIIELNELSKKHNKQVIFTTHSPAILDGLDLSDKNQKLIVVYRNKLGETKVEEVSKPKPLKGQDPLKLSEAFQRGYLGGLPQNF